MSEALWYHSYVGGRPPHCARLSRRPTAVVWSAAIDLAIAFAEGSASYRQAYISVTGEQYWYWEGSDSRTGWWLIPYRVVQRAMSLYQRGVETACRTHGGRCTDIQVVAMLRRWRASGKWRRTAAMILPRHPGPAPRRPIRRRRRGKRVVRPLP